jgi:hypothetical protein
MAARAVAIVVACLVLLAGPTIAQTTEAQKIEYLIDSVEKLSDAKFIRNGSAYDARAAGDHLRMKLRRAGGRVKTADDFIRYIASKSSMSGEPYKIRFADGRVVTSEAFLRGKLKALEAGGR